MYVDVDGCCACRCVKPKVPSLPSFPGGNAGLSGASGVASGSVGAFSKFDVSTCTVTEPCMTSNVANEACHLIHPG